MTPRLGEPGVTSRLCEITTHKMHGQIMLERQHLTHKKTAFCSIVFAQRNESSRFMRMRTSSQAAWITVKIPNPLKVSWKILKFPGESSESGQGFWHTYQLQLQNVLDTVLSEHINVYKVFPEKMVFSRHSVLHLGVAVDLRIWREDMI